MPDKKVYVGDGVYAELEDFGSIVLTTEDGIRETNRIVLEPFVLVALERWLAAWREAIARPPS